MSTRENELRFKAQYLMADVVGLRKMTKKGYVTVYTPLTVSFLSDCLDSPICLKPLSQIIDEDAEELAKLLYEGFERLQIAKNGREYLAYSPNIHRMNSNAADFLRSKGYALPWLGISVDELVKWGWIKLKK